MTDEVVAPPRDVVVVVNRHSRGADRAVAGLYDKLKARGLSVASFHPVGNNRDAERLVRRAAKDGAHSVLVGGGDGTMTHAVNALAHRRTILGVLPLGTGNSFAQSLGLPTHDLDAAIDTIAGGHVATVDLGSVNGTYFANFATIGLSSEIAGRTPHGWKGVLGVGAYALAAVVPLLRHRGFRAKIRWDGGRLTLRTQDIIIASGRFFGTTPLTPEASLVSGKLSLFTTEDATTFGALKTYLAIGLDHQVSLSDAHIVNAEEITVRTNAKQWISVDGSLLERTPACFRVARGALRVFVPPSGVPQPQ